MKPAPLVIWKLSVSILASLLLPVAASSLPRRQPAAADTAMVATNADIQKLLEFKISEDEVVKAIQNTPGNYDFSSDAMQKLKDAGLTVKMARAMQDAKRRKEQQDQDSILHSLYGDAVVPQTQPAAAPPSISLSTKSLDFGQQDLATKSDPKEITITNTGSSPVNLSFPTLLAADKNATPPFQIVDPSACSETLHQNDHCKLQIVFSPFSYDLSFRKNRETVIPFSFQLPISTGEQTPELNSFSAAQTKLNEAVKAYRDVFQQDVQSKSDLDSLNCKKFPKDKQADCQNRRVDLHSRILTLDAEAVAAGKEVKAQYANYLHVVEDAAAANPNTVSLSGTPKRWSYPFTSFVAGLGASAGSSRDIEQTYFVQASTLAPLPFFSRSHKTKEQFVDPLERSFYVFLNPRITSLPFQDSGAAISSLNVNADFLSNLKNVSQITQGLDFTTGLEWICPVICRKPREGVGWISDFQGHTARAVFSPSFVFGVGGSTPFSNQKTPPPAFQINNSILQSFGCQPNSTFPVPKQPACTDLTASGKTNVAFLFPDRSRFFYKYFGGLRFKTYFFNPDVHGVCRKANGVSVPSNCEMPFNVFPGTVDITAGKDSIVTGGHLSKWLFRIDVIHPLPFLSGLYFFGSTYMGLGRSNDTLPITLSPAADGTANDTNTARIFLPRPDRDIYRIGFGIDLVHFLTPGGKPADSNAKPPASTKTTDAAAANQ